MSGIVNKVGAKSGVVGKTSQATTTSTSSPAADSNLPVGHVWINSTTGSTYVCTDATTDDNVWKASALSGCGERSAESSLRHNHNTWWYADFSLANSTASTNIVNASQGSNAISDVIPMAGGSLTAGVGSTILQFGTNTNAARTDLSGGADPFAIETHGMTMGCLFKKSSSGSGLMFYGDTGSDNHFFVRTDMSSTDCITVGEDTGATDVWTVAETSIDDNSWYFFVVSQTTSGTLISSVNGSKLHVIRTDGTPATPSNAVFGIQGDPYNDNANQNDFAQIFFYKGIISQTEIESEYTYLKSVFTGASLP